MSRRLVGASVLPGAFFEEYRSAMREMMRTHELLQPATLKSAATPIDDEMHAGLEGAEEALRWQGRMVDKMTRFTLRHDGKDLPEWPGTELEAFLLECKVVDSAKQLRALKPSSAVATARDLVKLIRIFDWTFESMPDDQEAMEITQERNRREGYPPPSAYPPMPPAPSMPGTHQQRVKGHGAPKKRRRKSKSGSKARHDEL
jgi:hypothetical protein